MSTRRAIALLACLALLSPLAALAAADCGPGQHCPMAGLMGDGAPCHGAAMQAKDCCVVEAGAVPVEAVPVIVVGSAAPDEPSPALRLVPVDAAAPAGDLAPSAPLYRLFRSLLI